MSRDSKNVKGDIRSQCADDRKDEVYELMRLWKGRKVVKRKERKAERRQSGKTTERTDERRNGAEKYRERGEKVHYSPQRGKV